MKKHKKKLSLVVAIVMIILNLCVISVSNTAVAVTQSSFSGTTAYITKASVSVHYSPYSFTQSNDTITAGQQVLVIERDGNYYYIEYRKSTEGFTRTGYILMSDVTVTGTIPWCNYNIFTPGNITASASVKAYFGPDTAHYMGVTMIPNVLGDVGTNDERPLLVLKENTAKTFYMVQYVANYTQHGNSVQPYYIRCWVPRSAVAVNTQTGESYFPSANYTLIRNVRSGSNDMFLTAVENADGSLGVTLQEATGYAEQQWKVVRFDYSDTTTYGACANSGGVYYKIISKKYPNKCLQLANNVPQMGTNIILADVTDYPVGDYPLPNKAQEFMLDPINTGQNKEGLTGPDYEYNGYDVGKLYRVRSRASGGYGCMSIANMTQIVHSRVIGTWVGNWSFERLNKYSLGGYNNLASLNNIYQVDYYIYDDNSDRDVDNVGITKTQVINGVGRWNNINSNDISTQINTVNVSTVSDNTVSIYARDIGNTAQARTYHCIIIDNDEGEEEEIAYAGSTYIDIPWYRAEIVLNSNSGDKGFNSIGTANAKIGTICHEFGHALKLRHPYGEIPTTFDPTDVYDICRDQVIYSVMNQGIYTKEDYLLVKEINLPLKVSYYPTDYDKQTLLEKWEAE